MRRLVTKHRGKWAYNTPDGRKLSTGFDALPETREAAEREARARLALLREPPGTVAEVWSAYMEDHGDRTRGASRLGYAWDRLASIFGHLKPEQISRALCRDYMAQRRRDGVSDGTISKELRALRAALRHADRNTQAAVIVPPSPQPRDRYLTREEAAQLIAAAKRPHVKLFIRLALATAARTRALLTLTWMAVDFRRGVIRLGHVQGGKGRAQIPMTDSLRVYLEEARNGAQTDWVIEHGGRPVQSIRKGFALACQRAGLEEVSPHTLRHTAAVWMAEARVPMTEIAQYLGHTSPAVTYRVYARYSPDHLRTAAAALDV